MDATNFLAASKASKEALKTATLLRSLDVNALIQGEKGVGKTTLAEYILPNAPKVDAKNFDELLSLLQSTNELIVLHLENVANIKVFLQQAQKSATRIIATASGNYHDTLLEGFFGVIFSIPPLTQREEDVELLIEKFHKETQQMFCETFTIDKSSFTPDLSKNAISLKRQIILYSIYHDINEKEMMEVLYNYLYDQLGSGDDYKKFLHLYEVPLIKAGLKRFGSQLQLAAKLGLNRNTLRKKILEHKEYLE